MRRFFLLIPLILLLSACLATSGGHAPPRYEQPAKPGGRLCVFQCGSARDHCDDTCGLKERGCINQMQAQAIKDYEDYTREQFKAHAPVELRPRDFERREQCTAVSCRSSCESLYDRCFENCGGKIVR